MNLRKHARAALVLALALTLLLALGVPFAAADDAAQPFSENTEVTVSTVDELLAAIAPDTTIVLQPGVYDLSAASDYGRSRSGGYYTWNDCYDGYELVIRGADNLILRGEPDSETVLNAVPRYAEVLRFENCRNLLLSTLTLGHTQEPGQCAGGVVEFDYCTNARILGCALYGCGVMGVTAANSDTVQVDSSSIYNCSNGAVWARGVRDFRLLNSVVYDCPGRDGLEAYALFDVQSSTGFAVVNGRVTGNNAMSLLRAGSSDEVYFLGTEVSGNRFGTLFESDRIAPIVEGCAFGDNSVSAQALTGIDALRRLDGSELAATELRDMALSYQDFAGPKLPAIPTVAGIPAQDGVEYRVSTVDELLACIGSDTTIYLDSGTFNWSEAANYGGYGGEHYYWTDYYDGPSLVITGVENFRLIGAGQGETTVLAEPRYANVIGFEDCANVTVAQLTAGHTTEPEYCMGDVLSFQSCRDIHVVDCGLFGCGVWGIDANNCAQGDILRTEIYECSEGAVLLNSTTGFVFTDCSVHDCAGKDWNMGEQKLPHNYLNLYDCEGIRYNGTPITGGGVWEIGDGRTPAPLYDSGYAEPEVPSGTIHLYFYNMEVSTGFTLTVGDEVLLDAVPSGFAEESELAWGVSDAGRLALSVSESGMSCRLKALKVAEGGVTLSVSYGDTTLCIPVYIHD